MNLNSLVRRLKLEHSEIQKIIEGVAWSQIYDKMFVTEHQELVNEAWAAILESMKWTAEISSGWVYIVALRTIVQFKEWRRSDLTIGRDRPQFAIKNWGLEHLVALTEEALDKFGTPDKEKIQDLKLVKKQVEAELSAEDALVVYMLERGDTKTRVWNTLERMGIKGAKWGAFNLDRIRRVWEKYL